jgi:hypothetical protein
LISHKVILLSIRIKIHHPSHRINSWHHLHRQLLHILRVVLLRTLLRPLLHHLLLRWHRSFLILLLLKLGYLRLRLRYRNYRLRGFFSLLIFLLQYIIHLIIPFSLFKHFINRLRLWRYVNVLIKV